MRNKFSNKETYHTFVWLYNTPEFYIRICNKVDDVLSVPEEKTKEWYLVQDEIVKIINEIVLSVKSGAGSNSANYMLEDIGNYNNINYNEILKAFLE